MVVHVLDINIVRYIKVLRTRWALNFNMTQTSLMVGTYTIIIIIAVCKDLETFMSLTEIIGIM